VLAGEPGCSVERLRGGLVFKAHRLLYHPTLGLRVMKKKETEAGFLAGAHEILVKLQRSRTSTCTGQWGCRHNLHALFVY